ncbi:MAG: UDP-N-acetylmuramoyl-L-alanyl-D-glutamate--2,6-diaminopimelate ligase [Arsenophonus endosymbiont of Ceratovacuna japonica]
MVDINLHNLLTTLNINVPNKILKGITLDSRKVKTGYLFLAIKGHQTDGRQYISQAIKQGVSAIIAEAQSKTKNGKIIYINNVPIIYIKNLNKKLSFLAKKFYQLPINKLKLIGITGTNGKTTTTNLIAQWAQELGDISAVMGTIGNGILGKIVPSKNTTNSAIDIYNILKLLIDKQATLVAMEISSHGLVQRRVSTIPFTAVVFTNLSYDHLDYHGDMKNYAMAKWLLFSTHKSDKQIINIDDDIGLQWIKKLPKACAVSIKNRIPTNWQGSWILVERINYNNYNTIIHFNSTWGRSLLKSPLIGIFNVNNIILAMATLLMIGYPFNDVIKASHSIQPVPGRMEVFTSKGFPTIVIDYAHTPDALKKALITLNIHCKGKLWCVFGCGGDRDKGKRSLMGAISEKYADIVIITDDNIRNEDPKVIINDILNGFINANLAIPIIGRTKAITTAIMKANVDDIILIAGKGHENYQIIGNNEINYSDRLTVAQLLGISI